MYGNINYNDIVIEELTKMLIKEDFENKENKNYYKITKEDLIRFSIKLMKVIEKFN